MKPDNWRITMEAYLDGELDEDQTRAFEELSAADPLVRDELELRTALRASWRRALRNDERIPAPKASRSAAQRPSVRRLAWFPVALAASLLLVVGLPRLVRVLDHQSAPQTALIRSGQVAAIGFGERPGRTVFLEPGVADLPLGRSH